MSEGAGGLLWEVRGCNQFSSRDVGRFFFYLSLPRSQYSVGQLVYTFKLRHAFDNLSLLL